MKLDAKELKDVGVKIVKGTLIECKKCKQQWSPDVAPSAGGRFGNKRWWVCPNGCNKPSPIRLVVSPKTTFQAIRDFALRSTVAFEQAEAAKATTRKK